MSYYDENGEYVGFDHYESHEKNKHEKEYHKSEVPTIHELTDTLYFRSFIEKSKEYTEKPVISETDDLMESYSNEFSRIFYEKLGDPVKAIELHLKDTINNKDNIRLMETTKEYITNEGTRSFILYRIGQPLLVLGVFYDKKIAMDFLNYYTKKKMKNGNK